MNRKSASGITANVWALSIALHAGVAAPLFYQPPVQPGDVYQDGAGQDAFKIVQGLTVDVMSIGDAAERVELAEVAPLVANATPPVIETKPVDPDLKAVITAKDSPVETATVAEEAPPLEQPRPIEVAAVDQAAQVEVVTQKSAGRAEDGGKATALTAYAGKINEALQKVKLPRRMPGSGSVIVGISLDQAGRVKSRAVVKSSGIAAVDRFAVEMVDKASFPPPPSSLAGDEFFNVPFSFSTKSS